MPNKRSTSFYYFALVLSLAWGPKCAAQQVLDTTNTSDLTNIVPLATLEWPPYSTKSLPDGGETVAKVREVFNRMGYVAKIDILPWSRAVRSTQGEYPLYLGYFPEYPLDDAQFILSASIGTSLVGLAQHKNRKLYLSDAMSLTRYKLGVVQDYVNTKQIDQLIANGTIKPVVAINDRQNLVRVLNGDIDAAVIDKKVMQYLLQHDEKLRQHAAAQLEFNDTISEAISLHIAFSRYHYDSGLSHRFNQTLLQLEQEAQPKP